MRMHKLQKNITPPPRVATVSNSAVQHGPIALPKNMCGALRHLSHIFYVRATGQLTRSYTALEVSIFIS